MAWTIEDEKNEIFGKSEIFINNIQQIIDVINDNPLGLDIPNIGITYNNKIVEIVNF